MAGLSRSEYLASLQKEKQSKFKIVVRIIFFVAVIVIVPQMFLFLLGLWIVMALLLGAVKTAIDIPEFQ